MFLWSVLVGVSLADCPVQPLDEVRTSVAALEVAFAALDEDGFDASRTLLDAALPCVDEPLEGADVLALHRAMGLVAFIDGDMVASRKSWGAVRTLRPGWDPPPALMPEGHLLRDLFDDAPLSGERVALDLAPQGGWRVDGSEAMTVPAERSFVLQGFDETGLVVHTGYHRSVAEVPVLDYAEVGSRVSPRTRRIRKNGTITGSAMALAAGGLVGLGQLTKARLTKVDYDRYDATRQRANVLGVTGVGMGVAAVGVVTVVWVGRW